MTNLRGENTANEQFTTSVSRRKVRIVTVENLVKAERASLLHTDPLPTMSSRGRVGIDTEQRFHLKFENERVGRGRLKFTAAEFAEERAMVDIIKPHKRYPYRIQQKGFIFTQQIVGGKSDNNANDRVATSTRSSSATALYNLKTERPLQKRRTFSGAVSNEISKTADQSGDDGIRAADKERIAATKVAKVSLRAGKEYRKSRPTRIDKYEAKKDARQRITFEKEKLYEMRNGREAPSAIKRQHKQMKRKQLRRGMEQVIGQKNADRAIKVSQWLVKLVRKAVVAVFAWVGVPVLTFCAVILLVFIVGAMFLSFLMGAATSVLTAYTSEDAAIEAASMLVTQLEAKLQQEIDSLPSAWEWGHIDEFRYDTDPIGHNPFELMGYLSVTNPGFDMGMLSPVPGVIRQLHEARYDLILEQQVETRYDTETSTDPVTGEETEHEIPYDYYILNVILRTKGIEEAVYNELMQSPEQELWEWYKVLMETSGARQEFGNPFVGVDWRDRVTSLYGYRVNPLGGKNLQKHRGLDIVMPEGTPIAAGITGQVLYVGRGDATFGNYVILDSDKGVTMQYAHCQDIQVATGDSVTVGDDIATVGNTGASTGSHLHIEIKRDGKYVNPIYALKFGGNEE